jgi:hypothetical protein
MEPKTNLQLVRVEESESEESARTPARVPKSVSPGIELGIRALASGACSTHKAAAALAGCSETRFGTVLNSPEGQKVVNRVRGELDFKYQALYKKYIDVVEMGLDHPEPSVALAAANLFAKTQIGTKTNVVLTAEDVVQSIMNGTYEEIEA